MSLLGHKRLDRHVKNRLIYHEMSSYKPFRDHTCYTMTTAGSQGFLNLLPIYLDHILYPTLTSEGKSNQKMLLG